MFPKYDIAQTFFDGGESPCVNVTLSVTILSRHRRLESGEHPLSQEGLQRPPGFGLGLGDPPQQQTCHSFLGHLFRRWTPRWLVSTWGSF